MRCSWFQALIVAPLVVMVACHDDEPKPTSAAITPSGTLAALGLDASGISPLVDPPRPAGDFKLDVESFTTIEDCMRDRAKLDPVVGDALENIGYDTFLRDACRVLEAAKTKDARRCTLIDASTLKARCNAVIAISTHDADACPRVGARPDRGRDPSCVAQATRSPVLCVAVDRHDRSLCDAMLGKDDKACDSLLIDAERASCVRDVVRWRSTLADGAPQVTVVAPVKATLEVHGTEGHPDPKVTSYDVTADLARGVVVVIEKNRSRMTIGETDDLSLSPQATNPMSSAKFGFKLLFGPDPSAPVELEGATLSVPGASSLACASNKCVLAVKIVKVDATRGGAVHLEIDGSVSGGTQAFKVHADIETFVRDTIVERLPN